MPSRNTELATYLAKLEVTEGTDAAPVAADAIEIAELFDPTDDNAFKNPRPNSVRGSVLHGNTPLKPAGRIFQWTKRAWWRGVTGVATAINAHELDAWLQSMGLAVTYDGTGAHYTPANTGLKTLTEYIYSDGKLRKGVAARAEGSFSFDVGGPLIVEHASQGILSSEADVAIVQPTLRTTVPPIATDMATFTIDAFTAGVIRRFQLQLGNNIARRNGVKAVGGVAGFDIRTRNITWSVTLEEPLIATKDFKTLRDNATAISLAWVLGGVANNKADFVAPSAVIDTVTESNDSGLPLVTISGGLFGTTPFTLSLI